MAVAAAVVASCTESRGDLELHVLFLAALQFVKVVCWNGSHKLSHSSCCGTQLVCVQSTHEVKT
jgi:hypothetical protein